MGKAIFILMGLLLGVGSIRLHAQSLSYAQSDRETYSLYMQGKWEELIEKGKQALKNRIDYYYLRVRMGVAYYYLGKYKLAIRHLRKAYNTNPDDPFVNQYLAYSYLAMGDLERAYSHFKRLPEHVRSKIPLFKSGVYRTDFNFLMFINPDYSTQSEQVVSPVQLDRNAFGGYIGYGASLSENVYLYQMGYVQRTVITNFDTLPPDASQSTPSGGMGPGGMGPRNAILSTDSTTEPALYEYPATLYHTRLLSVFRILTGAHTSLVLHNNLGYYEDRLFFSLGTNFLYEFTPATLGIRADYLLFGTSTYLIGAMLVIHPFMNDRFYIRIEPVWAISDTFNDLIVRTEAGFRIGRVYLSAGYYYGTISSYLEDNGYFVYATDRFISGQKFVNILFSGKKVSYYITFLHSLYHGVQTPQYNGFLVRTGLTLNLWNWSSQNKIQEP